jgi:hypothetical protein
MIAPEDLRKLAILGYEHRTGIRLDDREPQPEDGPDYHAEHAAWAARHEPQVVSTGDDS